MVFLAIRALGKVAEFAKLLPRCDRSPENVVLHLIHDMRESVPSVSSLSQTMFDLVVLLVKTHSHFKFAQMLQGENTPSHIMALKSWLASLEESGIDELSQNNVLKSYLLALVAVMCGLDGSTTLDGSLFMNQHNGENVLLCITCLQQLEHAEPRAIYWNFIVARAQKLDMPTKEPQDLAVARLLCLTRTSDREGADYVMRSWLRLLPEDRIILTDHFLVDGIQEAAIVFEYLPDFFANCKVNPVVGLHRALVLLVDLVNMLRGQVRSELAEGVTCTANLSDVANFASKVHNPHVFDAVAWHIILQEISSLSNTKEEHFVQVMVKNTHWSRVGLTQWTDKDGKEITHLLRRVAKKTDSMANVLHGARSHARSSPIDALDPLPRLQCL